MLVTRLGIFEPMGHHHLHHHPHEHASNNIGTAFLLNAVFTIIEIIGGLYTNSLAILSDAIHDFGDCMSLGLAWILEKKSDRKRDDFYSYGYRRYSIMGALITSSILVVGSAIIFYRAIPRLLQPEETDGLGMLWLALIGIAFNGFAAWKLHKGQSLNERTVYLHLLEDVLGWVGVLLGAIFIYWFEWYIIDPILSIAIALFVLYNAFKNLSASSTIFLQRIPVNYDLQEIKSILLLPEEVKGVHDLHLWTMDGEYHILSAHIAIDQNQRAWQDLVTIKEKLKTALEEKGIAHATLEFEDIHEECEPCLED